MSKHTPGPWEAVIDTNNGGGWQPMRQYITVETESRIVAAYETSACEYPSDEENAANARLIAAAPELLEALQWAVCNLQEVGGEDNPKYVAAMRAIAKATGEQA